MKNILITGGVVSSLGKGIAAASIGCLLEANGYKVAYVKIDPYLNVDSGVLAPAEHGETFVCADGTETDLDIGHYERFTNSTPSKLSNFTSGKIYSEVIENERKGNYGGETVQVIPHVTNEIKRRMMLAGESGVDFVIIELGGTVGDIESMPFLEAFRQFGIENSSNVLNIHLALAPYIKAANEIKTKPVQNSVKQLREIGIMADIILVRTEQEIDKTAIEKIALFCNVQSENVFQAVDVSNIYTIPLLYSKQGLDKAILNRFRMTGKRSKDYLGNWKVLEKKINHCIEQPSVKIAVVGKYIELQDAYKSIYESLKHASYEIGCNVEPILFNSENVDENKLKECHGILVPGGFGNRGIDGKINAAKIARIETIPYFGICLGMQIAVIEFARNVLGMIDADSTEFNPETSKPVICLMENQKSVTMLGGTMRLGSFPCELTKSSKAFAAYGTNNISERHRHRYEFNSKFRAAFKKMGMTVTGLNLEYKLPEIVEIENHPWFVGCQFHPEFQSKPLKPHPLFIAFVKAAMERKNQIQKDNK